jgi:hypothetical protein
MLIGPVLIWDLIDPWGIGVGWPIYLFFIFLYISAGYLVYMVIDDVLYLLDLVYRPLDGLVKMTASILMDPLVRTLKKGALVLGILLAGTETVLLVHSMARGTSPLSISIMVLMALLYVAIVAVGYLLTRLVRRVLDMAIRGLFRTIDSHIDISGRAKRYRGMVDAEIDRERRDRTRPPTGSS